MSIQKSMLIAHNDSFGPPEVVRLVPRPMPEAESSQYIVKVLATTVSTADIRLRSRKVPQGFRFIMGILFGFRRPRYEALGTDLCGEVVEVGKNARDFQIGDRVLVNLGMKLGGHAQYKRLCDSDVAVKIPKSIGAHEAVALVFGGTTALVFLRDKLKIATGDRLAVIGAGGAVGSSAVQLGCHMGARVTGVCSSSKVASVKNLGAHRIIDYKSGDFIRDPEQYDAIIDTVGGYTIKELLPKLTPKGRLGLVVADLLTNLKCVVLSSLGDKKVYSGTIAEKRSDLSELVNLCIEGKFKPLIGSIMAFEQIVEAHRIVENGHKLGSLVILPWEDPSKMHALKK